MKMGISHTEKQLMKKRIEDRITREIDRLCAKLEPGFHARMEREIIETTWKELKIIEQKHQVHELERQGVEIDRQRSVLDNQQQTLRRQLADLHSDIACILKLDPNAACGWGEPIRTTRTIDSHKELVTQRLMSNDPLGTQILKLQLEQDTLLDLVALATTALQFNQIWDRYHKLLCEESPQPNDRTQ